MTETPITRTGSGRGNGEPRADCERRMAIIEQRLEVGNAHW